MAVSLVRSPYTGVCTDDGRAGQAGELRARDTGVVVTGVAELMGES